MPSLLHEGLLLMVRDQPALVARLLTDLLEVEVPPFTEARLTEAALHELVPVTPDPATAGGRRGRSSSGTGSRTGCM